MYQKNGDGSVVTWVEETIMYVSSQVSVMTIAATDCYQMFYNKTNLVSIDVSMLDTWSVNDIRKMFEGCSSLTSLDLSSFDTANVVDMYYMFFVVN